MLLNKAFGIRNRTRLAQHALVAQTIYFATHIIVQQAEQLLCVDGLPQAVHHALIEAVVGLAVPLHSVTHRREDLKKPVLQHLSPKRLSGHNIAVAVLEFTDVLLLVQIFGGFLKTALTAAVHRVIRVKIRDISLRIAPDRSMTQTIDTQPERLAHRSAKRIGSGASAAKADCCTDAPEQIALLFYFLAYFGEALLDLDRLVLRQIGRNSDTFSSNGCGKAAFELSKLLPDDFKCVLHHGVHAIRVLPC